MIDLRRAACYDNRPARNAGCGLPLQKFDSVHVAFRSMEILEFSLSWPSRGSRAWFCSTRSRHCGESPAMFPRAQTACIPGKQGETLRTAFSQSMNSWQFFFIHCFHAAKRSGTPKDGFCICVWLNIYAIGQTVAEPIGQKMLGQRCWAGPLRQMSSATRGWTDCTCSRTSSLGDARSCTKIGTAPFSITMRV